MKQCIWYKNKKIEETFLQRNLDEILLEFKNNGIHEKDMIICKANTYLDVYVQWMACLGNNLLPVFAFSEMTQENIINWNTKLGIKGILVSDKGQHSFYRLPGAKKTCGFLRDVEAGSVIHLTSATTGTPKLVLRTKQQLRAELIRYSNYLKVSEKDVILPIVPINHSFGFISGMLLSTMVNATLVLPDTLLPRNIVQLSNSHKVTMMLGVPYFYRKMVEISSKYQLNDELRYIIASGGPMEEGLQVLFRKRFGKKLLQQYGSTETGSLALGYSETNYNCVGNPIPGVKFEIIPDEFSRPCLYVNTSKTIGGYITENGVEWLGDKYKTGDLAILNPGGNIEILGRCDDVLIVDGKKVDKKYVIACIKKICDASETDLYLRKCGSATELICEYTGEKELSKETFVNECKPLLAEFQIPKKFIHVEKISFRHNRTWKTEH